MTPYVLLDAGRLAGVQAGDRVPLDDEAHHHLVRVRRHLAGDPVVATDGTGREIDATLAGRDLRVTGVRDVPALEPAIEVLQAVGRQRKHDEVVRMLTEAGVDAVTAVTTSRTEVDLSRKAERVRARWRAVADSACAQSRRPHRPRIDGPVALVDVAHDGWDPATVVLVADPTAVTAPTDALVPADEDLSDPVRVVLVIGPEGGLTEDELDTLERRGASRVTLGPTVLRTEHAGLVLAAVVASATGRMG